MVDRVICTINVSIQAHSQPANSATDKLKGI